MLDVHPPHHPTHTWKDFFVHLATIVVGLLIAVGLEQTVESLHHRHLAQEFEAQMEEEFSNDRTMLGKDVALQDAYRLYLADLQAAINAKLDDQPYTMPSRDDPRNTYEFSIPQLSAYFAAKQNGTLSYLDNKKLGIFNRIARQHDLIVDIANSYRIAMEANRAFRFRYDYQAEPILFNSRPGYVDVGRLSKPELLLYRDIVGAIMGQVESLTFRCKYMNAMMQVVQDGAVDETDLSKKVREKFSMLETK